MLVPNGREEEEALEIERVLLARLQAAIDRNVPCSDKFRKSKEALQKQIGIPMDSKTRARFRKRLHILNNLLADSSPIFDHLNAPRCSYLKQITERIESDFKNVRAQNQIPKPPTVMPEEKPPRMPEEKPPSTPMWALKPCGLEIDEMAAENLLLHRTANEVFTAVGIVGSEGVGKTTLAQVIFQNDKVKSRFLPRIWVSLSMNSDDFDEEKCAKIVIAKRILLALGFDHETINEMKQTNRGESFLPDLICAIRSELTRKRYLIVLDGALESNGWYEDLRMEASPGGEMKLAYALPKGNGGAVVVTGRAESMVKKMIGIDGGIHRLLPLDEPKLCWEIYLAAAEEKKENMKDKEEKRKVKEEVVKRCSGHPAAAVLMGEIRKMQVSWERCWSEFLKGADKLAHQITNEEEKKLKEELKEELKRRCNGNTIAARKMGEEKKNTT